MKIFAGKKLREGFLDYSRSDDEYRIQVIAWKNLEKLKDIYFIRPRSLRLIWNYQREVGCLEVLRKILSRNRERYRNEKYISCGLGRVIESPDKALFSPGQIVAFLAPSHPPCVERIVLPSELIIEADSSDLQTFPPDTILYQTLSSDGAAAGAWWANLRGWSSYSGRTLSGNIKSQVLPKVLEAIRQTNWKDATLLHLDKPTLVTESRNGKSAAKRQSDRHTAVLFGYGNYAKTIILPNVKAYLSVDCIHEIDPTQIPINDNSSAKWDTSATPRSDADYNVFLLAGFHHTHAPLATYALQRNACAVVEKPIVVSEEQLAELLAALQNSSGQIFSCFHKRYLPFNQLALQDLKVSYGEAISYHCIVYEVPLPELHWYRWPNSKSRLVSNGCHWIDHFLYLNNFCEVRSSELFVAPDLTINCSIVLENGAVFTMVLTDRGSERIGVQDYIELRANDVTVKMINGGDYWAEGKDRMLRRKKINKMKSYNLMYQEIGRKIRAGEAGDSLQSVKVSGGIILTLENELNKLLDRG